MHRNELSTTRRGQRTYMHACIHTYIHACMHTYPCAYIKMNIHTYIHTYMHAYIYMCIHQNEAAPTWRGQCFAVMNSRYVCAVLEIKYERVCACSSEIVHEIMNPSYAHL
jgi:hypothetical protein